MPSCVKGQERAARCSSLCVCSAKLCHVDLFSVIPWSIMEQFMYSLYLFSEGERFLYHCLVFFSHLGSSLVYKYYRTALLSVPSCVDSSDLAVVLTVVLPSLMSNGIRHFHTVYTQSIRTPQLLTILVLKFEQVQLTTRCCVYKLLDEWQTVQTLIKRSAASHLGLHCFAQTCLSEYIW